MNEEKRFHFSLVNQRIKSFLPLGRYEHRRVSDGLLVAKVSPLFPRYLFVQTRWQDRRPVMATRGFKEFVGWAPGQDKPPYVPNIVIRELKSRLQEILGLDVLLLHRPKEIEPGIMVQILFGPFRDHVAKVQAVHDSRVEVLLSLFGRNFVQRYDKGNLLAA